jgi:ASPIC and UnbV/FG-GAP-like repeat
MKRILIFYFSLASIAIVSCKSKTLFKKVDSSDTGIHFNNTITENDSINVLDMENIYNGGGVGIGDFNRDGLPDIYFTGNMVSNKLYLNKGGLKFDDITDEAGVAGEGKWARGVSVVDINNDGWPDIYISETFLKDSTKRENILYINRGLDKNGIPVFKDMAKEYGLNDNGYTTQAAFFDYDNDGDLDVYMADNVFARGDNPNRYRNVFVNGEHPNTDRLYRNDWDSAKGHPYFTNVSRQAGILQEGFSHGVTICDINQDGWKDIYVTNDYLSQNLLYINNHDGTFTNECKDYFKHTAYNAMGADVVDMNNDGLSDVVELDMNPEDNYRKKTMMGPADYQANLNNDFYQYQYQYVRNMLQLNMGQSIGKNDSLEHPVFSDIGFYSGIAETDWSWTPLVADFDNDGNRDLIITNGFPRDVTDHDFMAYRNSAFAMSDKEKLLAQIPVVKIPNYAFKNGGNLKFSNVTKEWGMDEPSFSNGTVAVDLDNDGDLDVVVNNIDGEAMIYENTLNKQDKSHHYLKVALQGDPPNKDAFGSWIKIYYDKGHEQVYETNPVRGYISSAPNMTFFGLGNTTLIDSLIVIWPNNKLQKFVDIKTGQLLTLKQSEARQIYSWKQPLTDNSVLFKEIGDSLNLNYVQNQKDVNDFAIQSLLPHKLSQYGPQMAAGDLNNDGLQDLVIGGSAGNSTLIYFQKPDGKFKRMDLLDSASAAAKLSNDAGILLFDVDGDHDLDIYICSGGFEQKPGSSSYQDRLYINDGKGNFKLDSGALPINYNSKSCVRAIDYDKDGDLDLFIGERVEPWNYPKKVSGILLRNDTKNGIVKFTDVTANAAPFLEDIGLICDATVSDYDNDGWPDLVIAGEWMPITFLKNVRGKFIDDTKQSGISDKYGWWNCITPIDVDNDGKIDYMAGNLGENSFFSEDERFPINNYFNDFDNNGTFESITTKFLKDKNGSYKEYPIESRDELIAQMPGLKKKFFTYKSFAVATINDLFPQGQLDSSLKSHANYFASSYIHNLGNGKFELKPLPAVAQLAPVLNIISGDFNKDGKPDILLCGNDYGAEVLNGRLDAFNGLVLIGDGKGNFAPLSVEQSGIYIPGDARVWVDIKNKEGKNIYIVSQNKRNVKAFLGVK